MLLTLASNGNAGTHVIGAWRDTMHLVVCIKQVPDSAQIRVHHNPTARGAFIAPSPAARAVSRRAS
ncbi:hypothetical protein CN205_32505 [Sinorhizobium meliloti]|nr:hypothetical protein CN205_32505 [Sinorhizobium meliloti]